MRLLLCLVFLLAAMPARAEEAAVKNLLETAPTLAEQRARLVALARAAESSASPEAAADAWLAAAWNDEYQGAADSAIAGYRRAIALRGGAEELLGAVDALLRRTGSGDAAEALGYADRAASVPPPAGLGPQHVRARQAWCRFLEGRTAEAHTLFSRIERSLRGDPLWLVRMGQVALEHGDANHAFDLLHSAALQSRGQSEDVRQLITRVADRMGVRNRFDEQLRYELSLRDRRLEAFIKTLGARRLQFAGRDRFPLGATVFAPETRGAAPAIVALIAPEDSLPSWDSLGVRLRDAGFAVIFVDGRGSGLSVAPSCPLPTAWAGRRGALVERTADDAREALRALGLTTRVDTTRYTVMTSGSLARSALLAAERDPRVSGVVLVSPDLRAVERGPTRALVEHTQTPLYLVESKNDRLNGLWTEPLYRAAPQAASRWSDAADNGTGPETLRSDAASAARITKWIAERKARPGGTAAGTRR